MVICAQTPYFASNLAWMTKKLKQKQEYDQDELDKKLQNLLDLKYSESVALKKILKALEDIKANDGSTSILKNKQPKKK